MSQENAMKTIARRAGLAAATLTVAVATVVSASGAASASHWDVDSKGGITIQINRTEWTNWIYKSSDVCGAMVGPINERRHEGGVTRDLTVDECTHAVGHCIESPATTSFNALYMLPDNTYNCTTWTGPDAND
jgi:hypothetical protein